MPLLLRWKAQCSCTGLLQQFKQKDISIINIQFCSSNCKQEGEQAYFVVHFFFRFLLLPPRLFYCWKSTWTHKTKESGKSFSKEILAKCIQEINLQYGCATFGDTSKYWCMYVCLNWLFTLSTYCSLVTRPTVSFLNAVSRTECNNNWHWLNKIEGYARPTVTIYLQKFQIYCQLWCRTPAAKPSNRMST
jgi:hypothetical protein